MNIKFTFLVFLSAFLSFQAVAQQSAGFSSIQNLSPEPTTASTGEKPQSKPWKHAGKWWAVFPNSSGTHLWRLDGTTWTNILRLTTRTSSKADCKVAGDVTHILLYQGASSQMASIEYDYAQGTYKLWSRRTSTVGLTMDQGVETATIDIDGTGRMWLASAGVSDINVRWSDSPYNNWSQPVTIASGVDDDDICAVIAMPGKIGVLWSNQNTKRFGFKTHQDGDAPDNWSADEVPASQSAQNVGNGMADDHLNMALASDGTLYCAVKTEYGTRSYPEIALLVRRPNGTWDNLYGVTDRGTRPIVILNEEVGKVKVIYTASNNGGNIQYKESSTSTISFSSEMTLMRGNYNDASSSKDNYTSDVVVMATSSSSVVSVLASDQTTITLPATPVLAMPANNASGLNIPVNISWGAAQAASTYQAQVSTTSDFSSTVFNQSNIQSTSASISSLSNNTTYYWRVRANNVNGSSAWSSVWSFSTTDATAQQQVVSFTLVNSHTEQDHFQLEDGATVNVSSLSSTKLNVRANTSPGAVGSVKLELSGTQSRTYTDNAAPYALFGDDGRGNYYFGNWNPPANGTYTLRATPYSQANGGGTAGIPLEITFTIVDKETPAEQHTLAVSTSGSGTVTRSPEQSSYPAGSTVSLTATPAPGYAFAGWSGDASGSANPLSLIMDRNKAVTATFTATTAQQQVVSFTLVNSHTEQDHFQLEDGATVNVSSLSSTKLNVRANTSPGAVGSVKLELSGTQSRTYTDNAAPYALFGDDGRGNYYFGNWNPPANGTYTLRATPYSQANGGGTAGIPLTITFHIVSESFAGSNSARLEQAELQTEEFKVYPNPFTNKATLDFSIQEAGDYTVTLYDVKGMVVTKLHEGNASSSKLNKLEVDGANLPKGLYFIKLQTQSKTKTLKLMLDK
ncbi:InlB B-repeat-containing protein [Pontibacter lucknowensis]|nr:T9SS type A sorting domain-containing protein [Pontibacter lucknowensis]